MPIAATRAALVRVWANRPLALALVCLLSALTYGVGLLLPYNLHSLGLRPGLTLAKLTRGDPAAQAGFVLTFAILSGLYYLAWRLCRGASGRRLWLTLLLGATALNLPMLFLYPVSAADIFDNIVRGRLLAFHGGNPFYDPPSAFPADHFLRYAAWPHATSAYGPL